MTNMIKSIGMKSQDLIQLIRDFPEGGEPLVIKILSILCESSKVYANVIFIHLLIYFFSEQPTTDIVSAVHSISEIATERSIDLTSISPILTGHSLSLTNNMSDVD